MTDSQWKFLADYAVRTQEMLSRSNKKIVLSFDANEHRAIFTATLGKYSTTIMVPDSSVQFLENEEENITAEELWIDLSIKVAKDFVP